MLAKEININISSSGLAGWINSANSYVHYFLNLQRNEHLLGISNLTWKAIAISTTEDIESNIPEVYSAPLTASLERGIKQMTTYLKLRKSMQRNGKVEILEGLSGSKHMVCIKSNVRNLGG